jgi:hypothetical protein
MMKNRLLSSLNLQSLSEKKKEGLFTALYIGSLFIILAIVYFIHLSDHLWDSLVTFFTTLTLAPVPNTGISLPAPSTPADFGNLYVAAFQFSIALGIVEIIILTLRVVLHSSVIRISETIENIVFWFGASYLIIAYLVNMRFSTEWFVFWAGMILIFGIALLARAFVILAKK